MKDIVYYIATSLDGFIAGPDGDVSKFAYDGSGVEQYMSDLQSFSVAIMGRHTYEFGYAYGLQPGQPAYPHMQHYIFSDSLHLDPVSDQVKVCKLDVNIIRDLKATAETDIYLCGGGVFAGWLLDHQLIDVVKVKLNPFIAGQGTRLFGNSKSTAAMELTEAKSHDRGLQLLTYRLRYT